MNAILKAIENRSSARSYLDEPLTEEELTVLLTAGLQAPTAANRQEIHFTAVGKNHPILAEIEGEKNALLGGKTPPVNFYYDAPTVLFLSGDAAFPWSAVDAGIAVENIALAAEGLGLGSVIIGCIGDAMSGPKASTFAQTLQFPAGYKFEIAIAVGRKGTTKVPHSYQFAQNVTRL